MPKMMHVVKMQRFRTRKLAIDVVKYGMTSEKAVQLVFKDLMIRLRCTTLIKTMKLILQRVCVLTAAGVSIHPGSEETKSVNVRVFLAVYMIAHFPTEVFEQLDVLEEKLISAANNLLTVFETVCGKIRMSKRGSSIKDIVEQGLTFPKVLHEYLIAFKDWKVLDEVKLVDRIKHGLKALYDAEDLIMAEGCDNQASTRLQYRLSQERLRAKLVQIAGKHVLEQLDTERGKVYVNVEVDGMSGDNDAPSGNPVPKRMTNEQLNHELLLNPSFVLYPSVTSFGCKPIFDKIQTMFADAFWKSLSDDLRLQPPCYTRVLRVFTEIKDGINDLSRGGSGVSITSKINEIIQPELLLMIAKAGDFSWKSCVVLVESVMYTLRTFQKALNFEQISCKDGDAARTWDDMNKEMQAVALDVEKQPDTFCQSLRFVSMYTQAVRKQVSNHRLFLISPTIAIHGVTYESTKFDEKLTDGTISLGNTRSWVRSNIRVMVETKKVTLQELTASVAKNTSYVFALQHSVLHLIIDPTPVQTSTFPELLLLDIVRIKKMQATFRLIVLAASILFIVAQSLEQLLTPNIESLLDTLAVQVMTRAKISDDVDSITKMVCDELDTSCEIKPRDLEMLRQVLQMGTDSTRTIPTILSSRISETLAALLQRDTVDLFVNEIDAKDVFNTYHLPPPVAPLAPYIRKLSSEILAVISLNSRVHGIRFNNIVGSESAGLVSSLISFTPGEIVAAGSKLMSVAEAGTRLEELIRSESIRFSETIRVDGGYLVRDGPEWTVVETTESMQSTKALIVPIQVDLVKLAPGAEPAAGFRLVRCDEASSIQWKDALVGGWMQRWSIARLFDGKIDGIGYGGVVTQGDFCDVNDIGEALVTSSV
jgi:hypothetical protein